MRRTLAILAFSAAGCVALGVLFPRFDSSTQIWKPRLAREPAIAEARRLATQYGNDVSNWTFHVATEVSGRQRELWRGVPSSAVVRLFNPLKYRVLATAPSGSESILVELTPDGRPVGYEHHLSSQESSGTQAPPGAQAERELRRYMGEAAEHFRATSSNVPSQEGWRTVWEWPEAGSPGMLARFQLVMRDGRVVRAKGECEANPRLVERLGRGKRELGIAQAAALICVLFGSILLACWMFFSRLARRKDHVRFGLLAGLPLLVSLVALLLAGPFRDAAIVGAAGDPQGARPLLSAIVAFSLLGLISILSMAAGYAMLPERARPRWLSLRLLSQGRLAARPFGRDIVLGFCGGAGLTGLPYIIAALSGAGPVEFTAPSFVAAQLPALLPLAALLPACETLGLFALFWPWAQSATRGKSARWTLALLAGFAFLLSYRDPFPLDPWPNVTATLLLLAGYVALHHLAGMLAVWVAPVGMLTALYATTCLWSGVPGIETCGWRVLAGAAALLGPALAVWLGGQRVDAEAVLESMQPGQRELSRSDRERLKAEFGVARRAQQNMLPASAPEIAGYSISASCQPAREVGGDLYDFLPFPGGDWGFCVADVSGKGVPAALYMTLTKGMLAAACLRPPDLKTIASAMNRQLVEAGRHRTFVTMSLGLLDAPNRRFRHVRAGHNPPLLFEAASRQCRFLQPRGLGLGITASGAFDRHLEDEEIALAPGDVLVLYSDGLTECMNLDREQFGEQRLQDVVSEHAQAGASAIERAILSAADRFRGDADPHDDLTVVVIRADASALS